MKLGEIMFNAQKLILNKTCYHYNKRVAVEVRGADGSPYAMLSTNLSDQELPDNKCFFVKNYSENIRLAAAIEASGIFEVLPQSGQAGYNKVPVWRLKD